MPISKFVAVLPVVAAAVLSRSGEDVHCVGNRAHKLKYEVAGEKNDGSSMDGIHYAVVSLDRATYLDHTCASGGVGSTPSGDKQLCYGVNQNSDCSGAKASIPITGHEGLECADCYVAVKADIFYNLNYSATHLNSVQVGMQDIHLVGSASLHQHLSDAVTPLKGSHTFAGSDQSITIIDKLVGCPVCVKVKVQVAVPTTLDYELDLSGKADITVGGKIDAHLSDRWAKYDSTSGWSYPNHTRTITADPILDIGSVQADAKLNLGLRTSLQVNIDDIVWYHLNLSPDLPLSASASGGIFPISKAKFCVKGDAKMDIGHEANLDWNLAVWHAKEHWGPAQDYEWSKSGIINFCKNVGSDTVNAPTVVV